MRKLARAATVILCFAVIVSTVAFVATPIKQLWGEGVAVFCALSFGLLGGVVTGFIEESIFK